MVHKCMSSSCSTCCQSSVIRILPAKNEHYRYFILYSVIFKSRKTWEYGFLLIFVLRFYCNRSRALIHAPSSLFMRAKCMFTIPGIHTYQCAPTRIHGYTCPLGTPDSANCSLHPREPVAKNLDYPDKSKSIFFLVITDL